MKKENIYCFEVQTDSGHCRFTLSKANYESLLNASDKVKWVVDYFENRMIITKFLTQFITKDEQVMIGCLDGTYSEF